MSYYINKLNQKIAYKRISGKSPGIVFIHGLNSDMEGKKAKNIEKYAKKNKIAFIRFDCRGHGKSYGKFPVAGPVPPPNIVVIPEASAVSICWGHIKCIWVSIDPAVRI